MVNDKRLFLGSCFALITTAFSFSIRAGILGQLGTELNLSGEQLGFINSMWFFGFPIAMIIGGLIYHSVGPKNIMLFAFVSHALGILLTIFASSYGILLFSTFLIGLGNGCTEAACNPMIADTYSGSKLNKMLNRFHMWFPGGIVIGSLISKFMSDSGMLWQSQIWIIMIPTLIYAYLFWGQSFPKPKTEGVTSIGKNISAMANPLFLFIAACMALTAISEFGPQQWTGFILSKSGASPMIILAVVTGLMAVIRFFAGDIVKALDQTGVLLGGSIFTAIGIYLFSTSTGSMIYVAAVCFAVGVSLFWPVMLGVIAQRVPLSGAFGLSVVGGIGMFSTMIFQPIIGKWIDSDVAKASGGQDLKGMKKAIADKAVEFGGQQIDTVKEIVDKIDLQAGQQTLGSMVTFPAILIVAFTILYFWQRGKGSSTSAAH